MRAALLAGLMLASSASPPTTGQQAAGEVALHITVEDAEGARVPDLTPADFQVIVDGVTVPVVRVLDEAAALQLVLLVDVTTRPAIPEKELRKAVEALVSALGPDDTARVGRVGGGVVFAPGGFTRDRRALLDAAGDVIDPRNEHRAGPSPIWDAIVAAVDLPRPGAGRRAIVLITDGRSTANRHGLAEAAERAAAANVAIHVLAPSATSTIRGDSAVVRVHPGRLPEAVAQYTGGLFQPLSPFDWPAVVPAMQRIVDTLRGEYTLVVARPSGPGPHLLEIRVNRPGLALRARRSFTS